MKKKDKSAPKILSANTFPVVGIGASAGGLNAFKRFLAAIPQQSGMAYVLVQHLDPHHESALPELLQKVTTIPVSEITDDVKVLPDHIYIIPSNKMMVANDGVLQLTPRPEKSNTERNLPIDLFFTSLAEVHGMHSIGVVLSGTASDGTAGLKAIKDHGGITFAQDAISAEYSGMPQSAALAGVVDFVLMPEEMPAKLIDLRQKILMSDEELENVPRQEEDVYRKIILLLHLRKGTDFTYYKQSTIRRRILRRMVVSKVEEPSDYLKYLQQHKEEQDALYQDLLIPVTEFFRDPQVFENICKSVFPAILDNKAPATPIRIWVAACSTGQEGYSMAMCLIEFLGNRQERVQIFATDISEPAIAKARRGIYSKGEVAGVSPDRLKGFFTEVGGRYRLNKEVRDMCVFAVHNFLKDPPFGKLDLVSCRNVLIYLEPYLQKRALTTFHYALLPKRFLLLGKSESVSSVPELFAGTGSSDKLFTRKDAPGKFMYVAGNRNAQKLQDIKAIPQSENMQTDFQKTADEIILSQYTPAGVVVNEAMDIVHFRGNTNAYLSQAPGKPTHNLMKMARSGLAFELRAIILKAKKEGLPVSKDAIPIQTGSTQRMVRIEALPLPNVVEPHYLILFHETPNTNTETSISDPNGSRKTQAEQRIAQLEAELAQTREDMRAISEDQEAVNEELQSANEELLSSSEEMQSLNEELETSKEELQSTNEELTVLNQELSSLNNLATTARNYSEAVVATIHHPLLVMDKNLRVKSANEAFYRAFHVNKENTEGQLVYDLGNRQWNIPALRTLLEEIIPEKSEFSDYEVSHNFSDIGERIMLLSALEIKRDEVEEHFIMLTIQDITASKKAVEQLKASEAEFRQIADFMPQIVWTAQPDGYINYYNKRWYDYTGFEEGYCDQSWTDVLHPEDVERASQTFYESINSGAPYKIEYRFKDPGNPGAYRWFMGRALAVRDEAGNIIKWFGTCTDIQEQKEEKEKLERAVEARTAELATANDTLRAKNIELQKINTELESFTYVSSHDLQEPLRKIQTFAALIRSKDFSALSAMGKDSFQRIEASAGRMQTLIRDLLAFSHANKSDTFEKADLAIIIDEVMSDLSDTILERDATVVTNGLCDAQINAFQFRQVLHNLFSNALKFTRAGIPPHITIDCEITDGASLAEKDAALTTGQLASAKNYCHIAFGDNGIGFEQIYSGKMFDVFQRLNTRERYAGTGIGLAIIKKIVEQHGGSVTASGELDKGATFHIYIPAN